MSKSSLSENPYWDEKSENFGVCDVVGKTEVCAGHLGRSLRGLRIKS